MAAVAAEFDSEGSALITDESFGGCSGPNTSAAASPGGSVGQPSVAATVKLLERAAELYSQVHKRSQGRCLLGRIVEITGSRDSISVLAAQLRVSSADASNFVAARACLWI